jgi:hypothetical protein
MTGFGLRSLGAAFHLALVSPRRFASTLDGACANRTYLALLVLSSLPWSALLVVLTLFGHAPSGPLFIPVPRDLYYVVEALLVAPLLVVSTALAAWASAFALPAARHGAGAPRVSVDGRVWRASVGAAVSTSTLLALVIPDAILWALFGFETLAVAIRVLAPLSALLMWIRTFLVVRVLSTASTTRALLLGLAVVIIHVTVTAPFLR